MSSLLDGLLLDPYRDPREVWFAVRTDGQRGCGTQSDPYPGGTSNGPSFQATLQRDIADFFTALATAANHGLIEGDVVTVKCPSQPAFEGNFWVFEVDSNSFKYKTQGAQELLDVTGLSATAAKVTYLFDEVMRNVPDYSVIHLGPGVFETRGTVPRTDAQAQSQGWGAKSGQKVLGSGMGVTTLKLMHAIHSNLLTLAIGQYVGSVDDFMASDFTVDCNMRSQLRDIVAKGAIGAQGKHVRLRRVRAIDFGTQSPLGVECFVLITAGGHPSFPERVDCRIEDCVIEQPALSCLYVSTILLLGSGEEPTGGVMGWHRACALRHNYIDCAYLDNPVPIVAINLSGGTATVTTRAPHGRATNDWVVISGALLNGSAANAFNGSYLITVTDSTHFDYQPMPVPAANPAGEMYVDRFSSRFLSIDSIMTVPVDTFPTRRVRITTFQPHNRKPSYFVNLFNVTANGKEINPFNGRFAIKSVNSPTELEFDINENVTEAQTFTGLAILGVGFQALSGDGGIAAVVEGNRVLHCGIGGPYHDTWASRDMEVRNNYYHDVLVGPYQSFSTAVSTTNAGVALQSIENSGMTVTAATSKPHGLRALTDFVIISGVSPVEYNSLPNTSFQVKTVDTPTQFTYELSDDPSGPPTGGNYLIPLRRKLLESIAKVPDGAGFLVTATTSVAHGLTKGDAVEIINAGHFNLTQFPKSTLYNGSFTITDVPGEKLFRYRVNEDPGVDSSDADFAAGYFGRIWQARNLAYENNVIELSRRFGNEGSPSAISAGTSTPRVDPYLFQAMIARENVIRPADERYGLVDTSSSWGIIFNSCEKALLEGNVIDLDNPNPIDFSFSGAVKAEFNQSPAGLPIRGYDRIKGVQIDDLQTLVDDVQTLSLL